MKRFTVIAGLLGCLVIANLPWRFSGAQTTNPVTMEWVTPTNGQVVSGIIPLTVNASSTAARIARVEYYLDGQLIAVVTPPPQPGQILTVTSP